MTDSPVPTRTSAMLLFCPACQTAYTGVSRCPRCGALLLMPEEAPVLEDVGAPPAATFHPSPAARIFVGMLAALGLYLGLRRVAAGFALATSSDPAGWWLTADGLAVVFGLQAVAVVLGAVLAAAGRTAGIALGAAVGGACGGLFLAAEVLGGVPAEQLVLLAQPVVLAVGGAIAGAVGAWVWQGVPDLEMPLPAVKKTSSVQLGTDKPGDEARPTNWVRVMIGATVLMAGVNLAERSRIGAEKATHGALKVESQGQGKFLSCQMAALAVLVGGGIAGAGTGAGLRHGMFAGILGGLGVVGGAAATGQLPPPAEYLLGWLNVAVTSPPDLPTLAVVGLGVVVAALVGGWFGGQLFLPLAPPHMRGQRLRMAGD